MTHPDRAIVRRSPGSRHGPITRLISPGSEGLLTKPFVFLDYVEAPSGAGPRFGFHPHSGIATLTFPLTFDLEHEASTGALDVVQRGGLEWVLAGGGLWHRGRPLGSEPLTGFQLWLAMPPSHELAAPQTRFIAPADVPRSGPVTVLLGSYGECHSALALPLDVTYLWVQLAAGQTWRYLPSATHQSAWVFVQRGVLEVSGERLMRELAIFEPGHGPLELRAHDASAFVLGSAPQHPYELVLGSHSVHTCAAALAHGVERIAEIGGQLQRAGRLE